VVVVGYFDIDRGARESLSIEATLGERIEFAAVAQSGTALPL
jgi:hypothetical protein